MTIDKTQKSHYKGLIYPYAISSVQEEKENNRYSQKEKSKSLSKVYQSEDFSSKNRGSLNLNKNGSNYLYQRQVRLEEEYKKMVNPYTQKKLNIGVSWIKDNPLVFNEVPYNNNKTENSHSSLKNAGTSVIQKN